MKKSEFLKKQGCMFETVKAVYCEDSVFAEESTDEWTEVHVTDTGRIFDVNYAGQVIAELTLDMTATDEYARVNDSKPFREWDFNAELALYFDGSNWRLDLLSLNGVDVEVEYD